MVVASRLPCVQLNELVVYAREMDGGIKVEEVVGRREKKKSLPFIVWKVYVCIFMFNVVFIIVL